MPTHNQISFFDREFLAIILVTLHVNDSFSPILENLFILHIFHHFCIKALIIGPIIHLDLNLDKNLVIFCQYSQFYCKPLVALQIAVCFSFTGTSRTSSGPTSVHLLASQCHLLQKMMK